MAASGDVLLGQPGLRRIGDVVLDNSANSGSGLAAVEAYFRPIFIAIQNVASVGRSFLPLSDSGKPALAF